MKEIPVTVRAGRVGTTRMSNRRKFPRRPLTYPAKIIANDGSWGRNCRVVDVSDGGARLVTAEPFDLPENFTLALSRKTARRCRLKWMENCEIGVVFVR
jgi:hypothetical protein